MATYNATGFATTVTPGRSWQAGEFVFLLQNKIDFSVSDIFTTTALNAAVVQALPVKAGWGVMYTVVHVTTACSGATTLTADVGDGSDANGWDASIDLTSTGYSVSAVGTDALAIGSPKLYTSNDTIDFTLTVSGGGAVLSSGIVVVSALVIDHSYTQMPAVGAAA